MTDPLAFSDEHMTRLGLTLDFDPDDLAANQDGELSDQQITRLANDLRWFYWPMIIGLALVAFVIGATSALAGELALFPVFLLMALAAIPAFLLKQQRERLPDQTVRVTTLKIGRFSLTARAWGLVDEAGPLGGVKYPVAGGKDVFGPQHLYKVLQANQTYLAYYAPVRTWRGFRLLSIEPLAQGFAPKAKVKPKR